MELYDPAHLSEDGRRCILCDTKDLKQTNQFSTHFYGKIHQSNISTKDSTKNPSNSEITKNTASEEKAVLLYSPGHLSDDKTRCVLCQTGNLKRTHQYLTHYNGKAHQANMKLTTDSVAASTDASAAVKKSDVKHEGEKPEKVTVSAGSSAQPSVNGVKRRSVTKTSDASTTTPSTPIPLTPIPAIANTPEVFDPSHLSADKKRCILCDSSDLSIAKTYISHYYGTAHQTNLARLSGADDEKGTGGANAKSSPPTITTTTLPSSVSLYLPSHLSADKKHCVLCNTKRLDFPDMYASHYYGKTHQSNLQSTAQQSNAESGVAVESCKEEDMEGRESTGGRGGRGGRDGIGGRGRGREGRGRGAEGRGRGRGDSNVASTSTSTPTSAPTITVRSTGSQPVNAALKSGSGAPSPEVTSIKQYNQFKMLMRTPLLLRLKSLDFFSYSSYTAPSTSTCTIRPHTLWTMTLHSLLLKSLYFIPDLIIAQVALGTKIICYMNMEMMALLELAVTKWHKGSRSSALASHPAPDMTAASPAAITATPYTGITSPPHPLITLIIAQVRPFLLIPKKNHILYPPQLTVLLGPAWPWRNGNSGLGGSVKVNEGEKGDNAVVADLPVC